MNALQRNYRAVINDVAADIERLRQSGRPGDAAALKMLCKRHQWLVCRKDKLNNRCERSGSGFKICVDGYVGLCETFWKERHGRTYEKKMDDLIEVKQRVVKIYSLSGFDACYALLIALKPLRSILLLPKYDEYVPALSALEQIKSECITQLGAYIHP